MKRNSPERRHIISQLAISRHQKEITRRKLRHKRKRGWEKYVNDVRANAIRKNVEFERPKLVKSTPPKISGPKPELSETIKYISSKRDAFTDDIMPKKENGDFLIPEQFSLTDNYPESFQFLKRLFFALFSGSTSQIILDYANCKRIDVDASVCMDILLGEYMHYYIRCRKAGHHVKLNKITPKNYQDEEIRKILFSIGAFSSLKGVRIRYEDIIPFPLRFGIIKSPNASKNREVHITQLVDYVIKSLAKMNRTLTERAERDLFQVIGEILVNAEEHSSGDKRFCIGYFRDTYVSGEHSGVFNLVILNFGRTIYEMFSDPDCPNKKAVNEMRVLSEQYTKKGLFSKSEFEEESLWTLYALQEGVTSKADWKRGNGSIRFIESFFNLKGDNEKDNLSYLSIVSGHTRIIFDGTYRLIDVPRDQGLKPYKLMTFNKLGTFTQPPDKKYVNFVPNYFPGTIITARICFKEINTERSNGELPNLHN